MTRRPDTIFLRGLEVECIIGFIEWERRIKQRLVIDLEMPIDCAHAAATDEVGDTLDYSEVAARVTAFVGSSSTMLVETLAHRTAMLILAEFRLEWVRLSINKPGAVRGARDVGVSIERHRTDLPAAG
jgi:dihydroneopterin aldolase